jgi:hypothetical protein
LPASAALVAHEAHHRLFGRSLSKRIGTVRHRHNQLSRRSARSICAVALSMSASLPVVPMRSYLPPGPHVPHEPGSVCQSRHLDPGPFLRLDDARQPEAEIMLLGLWHAPILRHRNLSERYHTQTTELTARSIRATQALTHANYSIANSAGIPCASSALHYSVIVAAHELAGANRVVALLSVVVRPRRGGRAQVAGARLLSG